MNDVRNENPPSATITSDFTKSTDAASTGRAETALDIFWAGTVPGHRNALTARAPAGVLAGSDKVCTILQE